MAFRPRLATGLAYSGSVVKCFRLVLKPCPSKNGILFGECQPKPSKRNGTLNRRFEPPREAGYADAILCMEV